MIKPLLHYEYEEWNCGSRSRDNNQIIFVRKKKKQEKSLCDIEMLEYHVGDMVVQLVASPSPDLSGYGVVLVNVCAEILLMFSLCLHWISSGIQVSFQKYALNHPEEWTRVCMLACTELVSHPECNLASELWQTYVQSQSEFYINIMSIPGESY